MKKIIAFLIIMTAALCSCSRKVVGRIETDTVYVTSVRYDSIYIEREKVVVDSVVIRDSIIVTKDEQGGVTALEKYHSRDSSVERETTKLEANVARTDTLYVEKSNTEKVYVPPENNLLMIKIGILIGFIASMVLCWLFLKLTKR